MRDVRLARRTPALPAGITRIVLRVARSIMNHTQPTFAAATMPAETRRFLRTEGVTAPLSPAESPGVLRALVARLRVSGRSGSARAPPRSADRPRRFRAW